MSAMATISSAGDLLIVFEMLLGSLSRADQADTNGSMF